MSFNKLKNPPIKEAIIRVSFKDNVDVESLNKFCKSSFIKENYPIRQNLMALEIKSTMGVKSTTTAHKHEGFLLNCGEGCNKSIQSKVGQLSFHNTDKYLGWELFYEEFKKIWKNYYNTIGRIDIIQLGVRYINQLHFDLPLKDGIEEFLKILPTIPNGINKDLNNFFMQLNIPNDNQTLNGIITQTLRDVSKNKLQVLLDLNVVKTKNINGSSEEIWQSFDDIRNFKNQLFFNSLTNKTIQQYE